MQLVSVVFVLAATGAQSQIIETIAGSVNYAGAGALQVPVHPRGVAVSPDGHAYVTDVAGNRVLRYDASTGTVTNIAGTGIVGFSGDGGPATNANLRNPRALAFDAAGNLYIADDGNARVRKVDAATGVITTVAGSGMHTYQGDGGPAFAAGFQSISGISLDAAGNLYISDELSQRIRVVAAASGVVTTIAGNGTAGYAGDGGPATNASFSRPEGIAVDAAGNLYITDQANNVIREIAAGTGIVTTIVGTGNTGPGPDGVPANQANLTYPAAVTLDASGNLYITDQGASRVRRVAADTGVITTVLGGGSTDGDGPASAIRLVMPDGVAVDSGGAVYVADWENNRLRRFDPATQLVTTLVGNGTVSFCGEGQPAIGACLANPGSVVVDAGGNVYIADTGNGRIRRIDAQTAIITTVAGNGGAGAPGEGVPATSSIVYDPTNIALDAAGNLYIADPSHNRVRKVDAATGILKTVAGNGTNGFCGDGGLATNACLNQPWSVTVDAAGNLYIADQNNGRIREVAAGSGVITTVAGNGNSQGPLGDGGPATAASLFQPIAVAVDAAGNLFIADLNHYRIRRVDAQSAVITTIAGTGGYGFGGDGGPATSAVFTAIWDLTVDAGGNIYLIDGFNNRIRRIDAQTGVISTVAGNGLSGFSGDGGPPTSASLYSPMGVAVDAAGNLYIAETNNNRIREVIAHPRDTTPPLISITTPTNGVTYGLYASVTAQYACSDSQSGVATCAGSVANGVLLNTSAPGSHTFSVSATDVAGNTATVSQNYAIASQLNFQGFLAPASNAPVLNVVARGHTVPIKWRLPDGNGGYVSNFISFVSLTSSPISCPTAGQNLITENATGATGLRYDAATTSFIYNWPTMPYSSGCRNVAIKLGDGSLHQLLFKIQ